MVPVGGGEEEGVPALIFPCFKTLLVLFSSSLGVSHLCLTPLRARSRCALPPRAGCDAGRAYSFAPTHTHIEETVFLILRDVDDYV